MMTINEISNINPRKLVDLAQKGYPFAQDMLAEIPGSFVTTPSDLAVLINKNHGLAANLQKDVSGGLIDYSQLINISTEFHKRSGTFDVVKRNIDLISTNAMKLRIAHTPDLFAYLGLYVQFIFLDLTAKQLFNQSKNPVCMLFFLVDHETVHDKRLRTSHIPDIEREHGSLRIRVPLQKESLVKADFGTDRPSLELIDRWIQDLDHYIFHNISILRRSGFRNNIKDIFRDRLGFIKEELLEAYNRSSNLAEFNTIFLSRIVNKHWGIPVAFLPVTISAAALEQIYKHLLSLYPEMVGISHDVVTQLRKMGISIKDNLILSADNFPLWYICKSCCTRVHLIIKSSPKLLVQGKCDLCNSTYSFDLGTFSRPNLEPIHHNTVPKVLFDELTDIIGWRICGGTSYIGSAEHIIVNSLIASRLGFKIPFESIWRPRGIHLGLAELRYATQTTTLPNKHEKIISAMSRALLGRGGILYFFLSQGVDGLINLWKSHFESGKRLYDPVLGNTPFNITSKELKRLFTLLEELDAPPCYSLDEVS